MSADNYVTFLVEMGPERAVGRHCIRAMPYTIWSTQEIPDPVVHWLAGNSSVVGPGQQGQGYCVVGRGRAVHVGHPHLTHWVQVDWTINSGD